MSFAQQNSVDSEMRKNLTFLVLNDNQDVFKTYYGQDQPKRLLTEQYIFKVKNTIPDVARKL